MTPNTILDEALAVIDRIEKGAVELSNERDELKDYLEASAQIEAEIYDEVCSKTNSVGKPEYGNDGARKAAALKEQAGNKKLGTIRSAIRGMKEAIAIREAALAADGNRLSIYKAYLNGGNFAAMPVAELTQDPPKRKKQSLKPIPVIEDRVGVNDPSHPDFVPF